MGVSVQGVGGSRYARHVGRVGALAVALGVGAAVATGQGMGLGIARADESGAGEGSVSVASSTDPSSPDTGDQAAAPTPPAGSDHSDSDDTDGDADDSGMNVGSSGGADTSVNDEGQSTDTPPDPDEDEPDSGDDGAEAGDDDVTTEPDLPSAPGPHAGTAFEPSAPKNDSSAPPVVTPNQSRAESKSDTDGDTASTTRSQASLVARTSANDASASLTTFATVDEPAVATTQEQQSLSVPNTVVGLASTFVAALLAPFFAPGPAAPAEPPLLWAVLAWVRREVTRTFFNQTPIAVADPVTTSEDTPKVIDVLANDTDDFEQDSLAVTGVTQPANGTVAINPDGTLTYTPKANWSGTDTFSYTVSDADSGWHLHGLLSLFTGQKHTATGTVTVTVDAVNDGAPAATGDAVTVAERGTTTISVLANDTDPDGNATIDATSIQIVTQPGHGSVTVNTNGTITYQSNGAEVLSDSFSYTVKDATGAVSNTATVTVTITPVNDAPVAGNPAFDITAVEHTVGKVTGDVNVTDQDPGDGVTYSLANPVDPAIGAVTVNATTGVWTFTPTAQARLDSYTTPGDQTVTFVINATDGDATTAVTVKAPIDPDPLDTYFWDTFPVGANPQFAVTRGDRLYVAAGAGIYVIDTTTDKFIDINPATPQVDPIGVGGSYATIDGDRLYVSSGGTVTVIDLNSNSVVGGPIDVGSSSVSGMVVSGNRLYASSQAGTVHVVDLSTNSVVGTPIQVGAGPTGMAASGTYVYVVNRDSDSVSVINTATNTVVGTPIPVGRFPGAAVVSGNRLFVANVFGTSVSVIDTTTNTLIDVNPATPAIDAIRVVGPSLAGIAVRGDRLYVAHWGATGLVTVVDTNTYAVVQTIRVRPGALDIAVSGNKIYVTSSAEGIVTILISPRPV